MNIEGTSVRVTVFDTSTEEDFEWTTLLNIQVRIHAVILVYDVRNRRSFEQIYGDYFPMVQETGLRFSRLVLAANK